MNRILIVLLLMHLPTLLFSQLNQVDSGGRKQGEWRISMGKGGEEVYQYKNDSILEYKEYYKGEVTREQSLKDGLLIDNRFNVKHILTSTTVFKEGRMDSFESYWHNGKVRVSASFSNGLLNGPLRAFYENGNINSEIYFRDGMLLSAERIYGKDGHLRVMKYPRDNGRDMFVRAEFYNKDGSVKSVKAINDRPYSYILFGSSVHQSGMLTGEGESNYQK